MFTRALAFNWVICGPDAHAKNYSLLLAGPEVRLAPLYDISSVASYPNAYSLRTMAMAMSINGKYQNSLVTAADWRAYARSVDLDPDEVVTWVYDVVTKAPDAMSDAVARESPWIQDLGRSAALVDGIAQNAPDLLRYSSDPQ